MPSRKAGKLAVDRESLGEALHTALRKCCDSHPTSLVWNLVYIMDNDVWGEYLEHVFFELEVAKRQKGSVEWWKVLKLASLRFRKALEEKAYIQRSKDRDKINWHSVNCLDISFRYFDDGDWKSYASFLAEEEEEWVSDRVKYERLMGEEAYLLYHEALNTRPRSAEAKAGAWARS